MFSKQVYIKRRFELARSLKQGVILFLGNEMVPVNYPSNTYRFRQESSFLYYFGIDVPGLAAVVDCETGDAVLFGKELNTEDIVWTGKIPTLKEMAEKSGISKVMLSNNLPDYIGKILESRKIHYFIPYQDGQKNYLSKLLGKNEKGLKVSESISLIMSIINQRTLKEDIEIDEIEKTLSEVTLPMYEAALKVIKPGIHEREIMGLMEGIALQKGNGIAYQSIVSVHGEVLHNTSYNNRLSENKLLLIDAGAQSANCYATDITRTYPVNGKFSEKQKDIYNIVLKAQKESIAMTRPEVLYKDVHLNASRIIAEGLIGLGLMKGSAEEIVLQGAHALFFPHGLGHLLGLDVHDMENLGAKYIGYDHEIKRDNKFGISYLRYARRLKQNTVITAEPGIYFIPELIKKWKAEKLHKDFINYDKITEYEDFGGIRIEDTIVITSDGARVLGKGIPKEIGDIETAMG